MMDAGVWKSHPSTLLCTDLWEVCQCRGVEEPCRKEREFSSLESPSSVFYFAEGGKKRERRGRKNTTEYFSKSPTLFYYQVVLYLHAAGFESIGSNR